MNKNEKLNQLVELLDSGDIDINNVTDELYITCDGEHSEEFDDDRNTRIREGNKFYMVLSNQEDEWNIEGIKCIKCDIKDIFNGTNIEEKGFIAVVESRIKKADLSTNELNISEYDVWELTEINKSVN